MSFYTVVPSGTFRLIYVCPSNTKSSPPLKSAFTLIYVAIMFVVILLCVKIWKKYGMTVIKNKKFNPKWKTNIAIFEENDGLW